MYSIKETNVKARSWTDSNKTIFGMKWLTKIGFWNARTMRKPGKLKQATKEMERYNGKHLALLTTQHDLILLYSCVPTVMHIEVVLALC
jgi:hypothetical protein